MCLLSDVTIPRKADRALRVSSFRLHVGPKATLATWFSYGVQLVVHHGGYSCQNPSIFPTYEFVGYPFTTRNPPFFRRPLRPVCPSLMKSEPQLQTSKVQDRLEKSGRINHSFKELLVDYLATSSLASRFRSESNANWASLSVRALHLLCEGMKIVGN